jgi:hypothetical protein
MDIAIDPSERWVIFGKTGSGKTQYAKHLLRIVAEKMPVVIVDPNELWCGKYPQWETEKKKPGTIDKPHLIDKFNPKWHVQCLQPDVDGSEPDERLERLCYDVLAHENIFIYFDETEGIATATHVPRYIRRIWKTGRAHGIGAWAVTQAPKGIPRIFKSQAEKLITFKVGDEDVDTVAALVHATQEEVAGLQRFEWLYYDNKTMDYAIWNPPIPYKEHKK